jgi:hypothetical protein
MTFAFTTPRRFSRRTGDITMMPGRSFIGISAAGIILAASAFASAQTPTGTAVKTGYAPVKGLKMDYEIHGTGEPLILLHGAGRNRIVRRDHAVALENSARDRC